MKLPIWTALIIAFVASMAQQAAVAADAIGWIPTWQQGLEEARQTGKPIMLFAGAPSCGGVPGVW